MKTFALAGNPNCGKTTLFNALTGSTAHVGNWPGVTVDKKEGTYKKGSENVNIVDLPGIYSLSPYTPEEVIARNYILDEHPDGIINIVDATNLERNLYLTTQLLEMDVPVIVALNMMDEVEKAGDKIDAKALEKALGVPVVAISALKKQNIDKLMSRAVAMKARKGTSVLQGALSKQLETAVAYYEKEEVSSPLFHAVKLLEGDELEVKRKGASEVRAKIGSNEDMEAVVADERYKYISGNFSTAKTKSGNHELTKSDKIDKVLTHRVWAIPIFLVILFLIFHLTFSEDLLYLSHAGLPSLVDCGLAAEVDGELEYNNFGVELLAVFYDGAIYSPGVILTNLLNLVLDHITSGVLTLMENGGAAEWSMGLVGDGVLGGIFAVLGFLPQILTLFLFFSILEDTGYMARIAFVLDRIFRRFGLSGRAFMPMIMGFGCSLPAMINTRTLADEKERTATIRVIPFFSCGAKLPILVAVSGAICALVGMENVDVITYSMYLVGIIAAIVCVLLMRNTTMKGETPPFIMELPAYHMPGFKNLMLHLWDKAKHFIKKAFTVIFATTVLIWLLTHLDWSWHYCTDEEINNSILASLGKLIQPIFTPLGFGTQLGEYGWVFAVAAIAGLLAKENVISVFGVLASCIAALGANVDGVIVSDAILEAAEGAGDVAAMVSATSIETPGLLAFIVFNMTTIPCFAACATAKAELPQGKFKWTLLFWLASSYIIACIMYTVGTWYWPVAIWLVVAVLVIVAIVLDNKGKLEKIKFWKKQKAE